MLDSNNKFIFGVIFVLGLVLCLISDEIFGDTSVGDLNGLVFSALIAVFGGAGLLISILKK